MIETLRPIIPLKHNINASCFGNCNTRRRCISSLKWEKAPTQVNYNSQRMINLTPGSWVGHIIKHTNILQTKYWRKLITLRKEIDAFTMKTNHNKHRNTLRKTKHGSAQLYNGHLPTEQPVSKKALRNQNVCKHRLINKMKEYNTKKLVWLVNWQTAR